jgi:hypothetical protein
VDVNFKCRHCGLGAWVDDFEQPSTVVCSRCGQEHPIDPAAARDASGGLARCWVCGCDRLYRQRDFNRKVGLAVVGIAAIFAVPTRFLSLVAAALIDLGLYLLLPEIAMCYHCEAIHRGFEMPASIEPYDLATHERYEDRQWGKLHEVDST